MPLYSSAPAVQLRSGHTVSDAQLETVKSRAAQIQRPDQSWHVLDTVEPKLRQVGLNTYNPDWYSEKPDFPFKYIMQTSGLSGELNSAGYDNVRLYLDADLTPVKAKRFLTNDADMKPVYEDLSLTSAPVELAFQDAMTLLSSDKATFHSQNNG
jgi:hypothetical protein